MIAPREAEALMHELTTVAQRRDGLDDQELASLEEQSQLVDVIAGLDAALPGVEAASDAAGRALAAVEGEIDAELAGIASAREALVAGLDAAVVSRYELLRARFGGPVIGNDGFGSVTSRESAQALLDEDVADLVAVGRLAIANPDLVRRWRDGVELNEPDQDTFYGGGAEGYTDYERLSA